MNFSANECNEILEIQLPELYESVDEADKLRLR